MFEHKIRFVILNNKNEFKSNNLLFQWILEWDQKIKNNVNQNK